MSNPNASRPVVITIVSVLYFLLGAFMLLTAVLCFISGDTMFSDEDIDIAGDVLGIPFLIVALIIFAVGYGLWRGWKIMWYLGVILSILDVLGSIILLVSGGYASVLSLAISLIILYYLFRPGVKDFFGI